MSLTEQAELVALVQRVDELLERAGMPAYSALWTTNERLRAEAAQLEDSLSMSNLSLSKARGDLVQLDMIVRTAASVSQIGRQFATMKEERARLDRRETKRFERRWRGSAPHGD
ncbi:MAG: hypothetical protein JSR40_09320 [Proteobacteria bacterium]|nr:hypothetical protein [Pseudomonadota bacterium]